MVGGSIPPAVILFEGQEFMGIEEIMRIGIDMDATITEMPAFFVILAKAFRVAGHKIYVVTYRAQQDRRNTEIELRELGIEYDELHLSDVHIDEGIGVFKARMARELDLDIFFDDMPEALADMPSKVKRMWLCDDSVYDLNGVIESMGPAILKF